MKWRSIVLLYQYCWTEVNTVAFVRDSVMIPAGAGEVHTAGRILALLFSRRLSILSTVRLFPSSRPSARRIQFSNQQYGLIRRSSSWA
jgi:hypothetical protein